MTLGRISRQPRVYALAALVASLSVSLTAAPAHADDGGSPTSVTLPTPTTPTTLGVMSADAVAQSVQLALDYTNVTGQLATVTTQLATAQPRLAAAQNAFQVLDVRYGNDQAALTNAVARLRGRAVVSYEQNSSLIGAVLEIQHVQSVQVGQHYINAAATADTNDVTSLASELTQLKVDRDQRADAVRAAQAELTLLNTEHEQLSARATSDQSALAALGGVPVLGTAKLTAQQISAWFQSTGVHVHLAPGTTIEDLARLYIDEGQAANVRGDVAFAQAIIETGSFGHATDNNYAGIGACDSCTGEPSFPTPQAGVRAQIQLLRSYADPGSTAENLGNPPDPTLFGADPATAAADYDTFYLKGKVPLWNEMGHGNWATDPNYAGKVLRVYLQMIAFADQAG